MNFKYIALALVAGVLILINGCSQKTNVENGDLREIIYIGNGQDPEDLDPHTATGISAQRVLMALFEGLVAEDPKTLAPVPGVAEKWTISDNGLVYIFHLRNNARWSNRDSVTAQDFVDAYKRALSPNLGASNAYMLYCMRNAKDYNEGRLSDFSKVGVKALDNHTLKITLSKPTPYFLSLITNMIWFPVDSKVIEKFGNLDQRGTKWTLPKNYVCNGPFMLNQWIINKNIKLVKNPNYWDAANVKLNEVYFLPINDQQTEENAFRAGQLHVTYTVPADKVTIYQKKSSGLIRVTPYFGTFYLVFNVNKVPFNNVKVRQALSMAIDRNILVANVVKGGKIPAVSFTPPNIPDYLPGILVSENILKAQKLLAEAGYPNGKGFPQFTLMYNTSPTIGKLVEALQAMWKQNLNVNASLINNEWKVYLDSFRTRNYEIATGSWIGDYLDPNTFLDMWIPDSGNNRAYWSNKIYDKLMKEASLTKNTKKRFALLEKAEKVLIDQSPIIPIYNYTSLALVKPTVKGWEPNILDRHPLKNVYLVPATVQIKNN